ncbi:hypothetical protein [Bradyrhizobium sp. USDA 10063]
MTSDSRRRFSLPVVGGYAGGLIACWLLLGFGRIRPFTLLGFNNDALVTLAYIKNYINWNGFRINTSLAFPGVQDSAYFPSFDFSYRAFMRIVALFVHDPAAIYYLLYVVGIAAMFGATVYALRSLRFNHWLSIIGAVVYVVSPWLILRALNHDFLALYFSVPLGAALAMRVGLSPTGNIWQRHGRVGTIVSLLLIATSGLYYAYFSLMFIAFIGTVVALANRTWRPVPTIAISAIIVVPILLVTGFGSGLLDVIAGNIPTVKRAAGQQLILGLNFAEATHLFDSIPFLRWVHREYIDFFPYLKFPNDLPDWPGLALTATILASPLVAAASGFSTGSRSHVASLIFLASACTVFGIIYSIQGGLAYYVNLFVNPSIRGTDRIIPFLSFFALVVLLALVQAGIAARSVVSISGAVAVVAALVVSMIPSINGLRSRVIELNSTLARSDANLSSIRNLLAAKDREGITAVLQLPHVVWPEAGPMRGFDVYSLMGYFILDRPGSTTRWSYGGSEKQPTFLATARAIENNKTGHLAAAAASLGFDGISIEKPPFQEAEWRTLAANVSAEACKVFEDDLRILYAVRPCR